MKRVICLLLAALLLAAGATALATTYLYTTASTNVRLGPDLNAEILATLKEGTKLVYSEEDHVDGRGVVWHRVKYNNKDGWISSKYTSFSPSGKAGGAEIVATGDCNIRSGPGLDYRSMGTLKKGASLDYLGKSSVDSRGVLWYKVDYDGDEGWISSKYAHMVDSSGKGGAAVIVAAYGGSFVRTGPGLEYKEIGTLYKNKTATYLDEVSYDSRGVKWYRVRFNGQSGWVSSKYCKFQ